MLRLGLVVLFLAPCVAMAYAYYAVDEPPPADGDLKLEPRVVPVEENGFVTLLQLDLEDIYWPRESASRDTEEKIVSGATGYSALAKELLERNSSSLEALDRAIAMPEFVDPAPEIDEGRPTFMVWRQLAGLQAIRAWSLFHEGKESEALAEAIQIARFGALIQRSRGLLVRCLIGGAIKSLGAETLDRLRKTSNLSASEIQPFVQSLRGLVLSPRNLAETVQIEYAVRAATLGSVGRGEIPLDGIAADGGVARYFVCGGKSLCFKPNQTKRFFAEFARELIERLEAKNPSSAPVDVSRFVDGPVDWRWPSRNVVGRSHAERALGSLQRSLEKCLELEARIAALVDSMGK